MLFPGHSKSLGIPNSFSERSPRERETRTIFNGSPRGKESNSLHPAKYQCEGERPTRVESSMLDDLGNPASRSLFLTGVPFSINGRILRDKFARFGRIESTNPSGENFSHNQFAYVNFETIDSAIRAQKELDGQKIFDNSGVPVKIHFDKNAVTTNNQKAAHNQLEVRRSPATKERINEWFRPRSREQTASYSLRRASAGQLDEQLPSTSSVSGREDWPNGPPPSGPKPRAADFSPPLLRRSDIYRPDHEQLRRDSYRPLAERPSRERRPRSPSVVSASPPQISGEEDVVELSKFQTAMFTEMEGIRPTPKSPSDSTSMDEDSVDAHYSPKYNPSSSDLLGHKVSSKERQSSSSNPFVQLHTALDLPPNISAGSKVAHGLATMINGNLSPSPTHIRRSRTLNDETCSVASELMVSDKTGISNISSVRKNKCFRCPARPTELAPIFKCMNCERKYHKTPECMTPPGYRVLKKDEFYCDCGNKELATESVTSVSQCPQHRKSRIGSPLLFASSEQLNEIRLPASIPADEVFPETANDSEPTLLPASADLPDAQALFQPTAIASLVKPSPPAPSGAPAGSESPLAALIASETAEDAMSQNASAPEPSPSSESAVEPPRSSIIFQDNVPDFFSRFSHPIIEGRPSKDYTCYWWKTRDSCRFDDDFCHFAHHDTGLMASPRLIKGQGKDSGKPITCYYFWKNGFCHKADDQCLFEHYDTGVYAAEPGQRHKKSVEFSRSKLDQEFRFSTTAHVRPISPDMRNANTKKAAQFNLEGPHPLIHQATRCDSFGLGSAGPLGQVSSKEFDDSSLQTWITRTTVGNIESPGPVGATGADQTSYSSEAITKSETAVPKGNPEYRTDQSGVGPQETSQTTYGQQSLDKRPSAFCSSSHATVREETLTLDDRSPQADRLTRKLSSPEPEVTEHARMEPSAKVTELINPTIKTAKRTGFIRDPRRRATDESSQIFPLPGASISLSVENPSSITEHTNSSAIPAPVTAQPCTKYNKCGVCSKPIFGSSSLCKACEKSKESAESERQVSIDVSVGSDRPQDVEAAFSNRQIQGQQHGLESITNKPAESLKGLKRLAPEDHIFITNKKAKRKTTLPSPGIHVPNFSHIGQKVVSSAGPDINDDVTSTLDVVPHRPLTIEELTELERLRRENAVLKAALRQPNLEERNHVPLVGKEPTKAELAEERQKEAQNEDQARHTVRGDISPIVRTESSTKTRKTVEAPLRTTELTIKLPASNSRASPKTKLAIPIPSPPTTDQTQLLEQESSINDDEMSLNGQTSNFWSACQSCRSRRVRCLHDEDGEVDPEKARKFPADYDYKHDSRRNEAELMSIRAAARKTKVLLDSGEDSEVYSTDDFSEDELTQDFGPDIRTLAKKAAKTSSNDLPPSATKVTVDVFQKTSKIVNPVKITSWAKKDERAAIARLEKVGVVFESDSDSESGDFGDCHISTSIQDVKPRDPLRQAPRSSKDLFDIAPEYFNSGEDEATTAFVPSCGIGRKEKSRDLLSKQCAERRLKFGNPHWEVDRASRPDYFPRKVKTVEERQIIPFKAGTGTRTNGHEYDVHTAPAKQVEIPFDRFLGVPEHPVACLIGQGVAEIWGKNLASRNRGKGLGFRDGAKDRDRPGWAWRDRGMGRARVPDEDKWPVGAKG